MANVIHSFDDKKPVSMPLILVVIVSVLLGVGTGYLLKNTVKGTSTTINSPVTSDEETKEVKESVGIADKETFPDQVEGILKEGGIEGEGSFHLERPGGESQNVYLTSTTIDLSEYLDKKVQVWGKTFQGQKAGWLMDVGYLEVLQ